MTILELIGQGLHYARTCRSLWLFGFFVGIASGGSGGANGGGGGGAGGRHGAGGAALAGGSFLDLPHGVYALIAAAALLVVAVLVVMRFIGEAALIEGVVRARRGTSMTMREGFQAGWAHWGVLLRIALLYFAATLLSLVLLATPCVITVQLVGPLAGAMLAVPALLVGMPWLVTLYLVQAFAWRIAVLDNRHALDAIGKARLFLHGRLAHGLRLIVAAFVGTLGMVLAGILVIAPVAFLLVALIPVLRVVPVIALACVVLLPVLYVFSAIVGTFRSSIWTIGYVTQVES